MIAYGHAAVAARTLAATRAALYTRWPRDKIASLRRQ